MADPAEIAEVYKMTGLAEMSGVAVVDGMDESASFPGAESRPRR